MKVKELVQWLAEFDDQDANVEVVCHSIGLGYYDEGGSALALPFDPAQHATYTVGAPGEHSSLLLGELNS